ncbi:MAG: NDP-sugar synthase [Actinomycetota bacterium]|nr:NDP-sugar synthase [Actinomycetota bacterium]
MSEFKTIFLVGGEATRLHPLSKEGPKALLSIRGVSIIDHMLQKFSDVGLNEYIFVAAERHREYWEDYRNKSDYIVEIFYEDVKYDTAGFILNNIELFPENFICVNGDLLFNLNLDYFLEFISSSDKSVLSTINVEDPSRFGLVSFNEAGQISGFIEKPINKTSLGNNISVGLYYLQSHDLTKYHDKAKEDNPGLIEKAVSFEREVFPFLANKNALLNCSLKGDISDVGTRESFIEASCSGDDFWIHTSSFVHESAKIENSVVMQDCIIEENTTVINSIIGPNIKLEPNSIIEDEIYC